MRLRKINICDDILQPLLLLLLMSSSSYLSCGPLYYWAYFQELMQTKWWDHLLSQQMKTSRRRRAVWIPISVYENILPVINIHIPLTYGFNSAFAMCFSSTIVKAYMFQSSTFHFVLNQVRRDTIAVSVKALAV